MRTYSKSKAFPKTVVRPTRTDYKNREATEWDVRLDLVNGLTSAKILEHAVAFKDKLSYCLIGGEENPDIRRPNDPINYRLGESQEIHVHVAIVLRSPAKREDVLQLLRGPRSIGVGNEYAVPRNTKFTYAGWVMHHTKPISKVNPEILRHMEFGTLPMDSYDEQTCWSVVRMMKKFGNPEMKKRFKSYSDKVDEFKLAKAVQEIDKLPPVEDHGEFHGGYVPPPDAYVNAVQGKLGGAVVKIE